MTIATDRPPPSMRSKLFEVQSLLDAVIEGTTDAIWAVGRDGAFVLCNAAAASLLDRAADELLGRKLEDVFPAKLAEHLRGVSGEVLAAGVPQTSEEELVRDDAAAVTLLALHVPYRDSNGDVHGVVCVARDISKRRRNEDALRKYIDAIVRGHDDERRQIARELHDEAGQALTSMLVRLRALERDPRLADDALRGRLAEVVRVGEGLHDELSRLARGLHPGVLENLGLEAALTNLAAQTRRGGLTVEADVKAGRRLPLPIELAAYRIVQESMTNVVKHAQAKHVRLVADWSDDKTLRISVGDDGVGFEPSASVAGIGLLGIRERVRHLTGELTIKTSKTGTRLDVVIPLEVSP